MYKSTKDRGPNWLFVNASRDPLLTVIPRRASSPVLSSLTSGGKSGIPCSFPLPISSAGKVVLTDAEPCPITQQALSSLRDLAPLSLAYPRLTSGAILCRRFAAGVGVGSGCALWLPSLFNSKLKNKINSNFKGSGRGRPLHTLSEAVVFGEARADSSLCSE